MSKKVLAEIFAKHYFYPAIILDCLGIHKNIYKTTVFRIPQKHADYRFVFIFQTS